MPVIPQFAVPPRIVNGQFATVEQGSAADLEQRVNVLCRTPPGWLDDKPSFGLADQAFRRGGADVPYVTGQLKQWVPDAVVAASVTPRLLAAGLDYLGLRVSA